jgi:leucyl-tRNA synthetase
VRKSVFKEAVDTVFILLSPFTPHIAEEVNSILGYKGSILKRPWPQYKEEYLETEEVEIAVLVNGKVREKLMINVSWTKDEIQKKALSLEKIKSFLGSKSPKKVIYVEKRMVNIVI